MKSSWLRMATMATREMKDEGGESDGSVGQMIMASTSPRSDAGPDEGSVDDEDQ